MKSKLQELSRNHVNYLQKDSKETTHTQIKYLDSLKKLLDFILKYKLKKSVQKQLSVKSIDKIIMETTEKIAISFYKHELSYDEHGNTYNTNSVANYMISLKKYFDYLLDSKIIDTNPFKNCKYRRHKIRNEVKPVFSYSEMKIILEPMKLVKNNNKIDRRLAIYTVLTYLLYRFGFRISEAIAIRWENIKYDEHKKEYYILFKPAKKGTTSSVYMKMPINQKFYQFMMYKYKPICCRLPSVIHLFPSVWVGKSGSKMSPRSFQKWFNKRLMELGIQYKIDGKNAYSPHNLRHTAITHLIRKGFKPIKVQKFARHDNFQTTLTYYHDRYDIDPELTEMGDDLL